ncbi:hypothetical protein OEZ85_013613 [Tetradesmus obliquus]|uniref:SBP-type domain-containing protein n=1 Tax=Tetradesmus obliquus TaxID=3088 RepID=A0ABY8URX9_TETOB|nr:hypothetical protein OEZ85_013613 [Tetradesmus obliquus]
MCKVAGCNVDLSAVRPRKQYCYWMGLCPDCMKAPSVTLKGQESEGLGSGQLRFCFQCKKLHALSAFKGKNRWTYRGKCWPYCKAAKLPKANNANAYPAASCDNMKYK